jgi:hypothetical protein
LALALLLAPAWTGIGGARADSAASAPVPASLSGDAKRPSAAKWLRTELYFSIGNWQSPHRVEDEQRWRHFLDREVTPRFPDGFSVIDAYGQWLPREAKQPERLNSKILVILHEDTPERIQDIDGIRSAWKTLSGDKSVLMARTPADIAF